MHHARTIPSHTLLCCRRPASEEHILALETGTIRLAFKSNNSHPKLDLRSRTTTPSDRTGNLNSYCQGKPRSSAELSIKTSQSAQFPINFGFSVKVMMKRQHGGGRLSLGTAETLISFTSSFRSQPSRLSRSHFRENQISQRRHSSSQERRSPFRRRRRCEPSRLADFDED